MPRLLYLSVFWCISKCALTRTGVQEVPDWRRLDLLGRPEVKRLVVRSARGMELLPEERTADW